MRRRRLMVDREEGIVLDPEMPVRFSDPRQRIASATSAIRTQTEELHRLVEHGGTTSEVRQRLEAAIERFEKVADELGDPNRPMMVVI